MSRSSGTLAALLAVAGCGNKGAEDDAKPRVAASIFPIYDLTRRIAGDRLDVTLVLPPGTSEHAAKATVSSAKLVIAVGLDVDPWVKSANVFRLGEKLPTMAIDVEPMDEAAGSGEQEEVEEHGEKGTPDPHVWLDPQLMQTAVDLIAEQLARVDPGGKQTFAKNAAAVKQSLAQLDAKLAERSKAWTKRTIVTFHGSMAYFAKRYDLRIAAVVEPVAGKAPSAAYRGEVLAAIKAGKAAAVFSEPQLEKAPAERIAKDAAIALGELDPLGGLAGRESYEALLTWNADQLDAALK
jgi:zinc transport system substrate-binding protein